MGFLTGGPYYNLIGRTGNNVGRRVRGKNVFSMRPHKSTKPPTEAQLEVRSKFGLMMSWLSWLSPLVEVGFQDHDASESAMNACFSYNFKNAITGVSPNFRVDYPKVLYSKGKLSPAFDPEVALAPAQGLDFNWTAELGNGVGSLTDMATVMVYNPTKDRFVVMTNAAPRSALTYTLTLPGDYAGTTIHCYISFVSVDGKMASNSTYIAAMTLP